ncbi:limonene-1,2-epoxide hydrolase family protein [Williamsia muralis]|uniref:Limonene-1,2-epoxide hydrolase family protein n=1 Tax=Williamsia marianensis TaxID=85044 RepID=A0ABU4ESM5_WILMA|nr:MULTISPECIES: limonene-1,2-epoxide hydrolase family protein [Williamsia]MDV7134260.1 limonene-1,2-epoxide hydrolase family protein [Williamsia muralis]PVY31530.1 limonene-1,2-epoxide hydrolase [Williamsia marianensis]
MTDDFDTETDRSEAEIARSFLELLALGDLGAAMELVHPDIDYTNVGVSTIRGKSRVAKLFKVMENPRAGFGVQFINVTTDGPVVLTERIDELTFGRFSMQFWVCGRFEIADGLITVWRDYFDFFDMTKGVLRGLAAIAVPRVQRPLPKPTLTAIAPFGG